MGRAICTAAYSGAIDIHVAQLEACCVGCEAWHPAVDVTALFEILRAQKGVFSHSGRDQQWSVSYLWMVGQGLRDDVAERRSRIK